MARAASSGRRSPGGLAVDPQEDSWIGAVRIDHPDAGAQTIEDDPEYLGVGVVQIAVEGDPRSVGRPGGAALVECGSRMTTTLPVPSTALSIQAHRLDGWNQPVLATVSLGGYVLVAKIN